MFNSLSKSLHVGVVGNARVGKTALIEAVCAGEIYTWRDASGLSAFQTFITDVPVILWEFGEISNEAHKKVLGNIDVALVLYDLTNWYSFAAAISKWENLVKSVAEKAHVIFVGSKADLEKQRVVHTSRMGYFASLRCKQYLEIASLLKNQSNIPRLRRMILDTSSGKQSLTTDVGNTTSPDSPLVRSICLFDDDISQTTELTAINTEMMHKNCPGGHVFKPRRRMNIYVPSNNEKIQNQYSLGKASSNFYDILESHRFIEAPLQSSESKPKSSKTENRKETPKLSWSTDILSIGKCAVSEKHKSGRKQKINPSKTPVYMKSTTSSAIRSKARIMAKPHLKKDAQQPASVQPAVSLKVRVMIEIARKNADSIKRFMTTAGNLAEELEALVNEAFEPNTKSDLDALVQTLSARLEDRLVDHSRKKESPVEQSTLLCSLQVKFSPTEMKTLNIHKDNNVADVLSSFQSQNQRLFENKPVSLFQWAAKGLFSRAHTSYRQLKSSGTFKPMHDELTLHGMPIFK